MAKSTAQIVQNWQRGLSGASAAYQQGTQGVANSPMAAAAAKADKALANYSAAILSGQWANALNQTSLSYWKSQCAAGASKLASGATKGQAKYQTAINNLQPVYAAMRAAADAAGEDPIARATAALQVIMAAGKKGKAAGG